MTGSAGTAVLPPTAHKTRSGLDGKIKSSSTGGSTSTTTTAAVATTSTSSHNAVGMDRGGGGSGSASPSGRRGGLPCLRCQQLLQQQLGATSVTSPKEHEAPLHQHNHHHHHHHHPSNGGTASSSTNASASTSATTPLPTATPQNTHHSSHRNRDRRITKLRHRANTTSSSSSSPSSPAIAAVAPPPPLPPPVAPATTTKPRTFRSSSPPSSSSSSSSLSSASSSRHANQTMEPPVLSFYGAEPVPLPPRFAKTKRKLVAGHEAALQASWARLLDALRDEVDHIHSHGPALTPSIDFSDIDDPVRAAAFAHRLKRYGVGVVRRVLPRSDADAYIAETVRYLETTHDFKPPPPQDPTCFDFFWTPAQVRTRAHPNVLRALKFAMSLWDSHADDRMATRFPISYADRIRIHGATVGGHPAGTGGGGGSNSSSGGGGSGSGGGGGGATPQGSGGAGSGDKSNDQYHATHASSSTSAASAAAAATARELLGDFTSSTVIAQVDNGSLERWEPDGYGRSGTYDPIFRGDWESYDPWDPTGRVSAASDLYNGFGACSIFRMFQGVLALSTIEPGMIRLLPSPKLATAYFLLRPFFSPRRRAPEGRRDGPEWDAYLDASNWELDREQSTIIHGAVPGHAQRLTEVWHPHLQLRRTLVTIPTLQPGDYIMWHPDLAYHITSYGTIAPSRAPTPPPPSIPRDLGGSSSPPPNLSSSSSSSSTTTPSSQQVSVLVYVPAAPLTQNNALYLARQRKTFQRGHPGPDFDSTGSGLGSEASNPGRPGEAEIAEVGGVAGLQAMGLAPFDVDDEPQHNMLGGRRGGDSEGDVDMDYDEEDGAAGRRRGGTTTPGGQAETEVARMANIILFPDRYDFYMGGRRNGNGRTAKAERE